MYIILREVQPTAIVIVLHKVYFCIVVFAKSGVWRR